MKIVLDELNMFSENHTIDKKNTDIVICDNYIPQEYKVYALNRGMDIVDVKELLGHQKIDTTKIYAKRSQENVKINHTKYIA